MEFRKIPWAEGYSVNRFGIVKNNKTNRVLSRNKNRSGYLFTTIRVNKKTKTVEIHRLVAAAFLPNFNDFPVVNHINGNKKDNRSKNLEMTTYKGNCKHYFSKMKGLDNSGCLGVTLQRGKHFQLQMFNRSTKRTEYLFSCKDNRRFYQVMCIFVHLLTIDT